MCFLGVLQCLAACCGVLQDVVATHYLASCTNTFSGCVVVCSAVCCSVLQCVAVCCSVLQCVAAHQVMVFRTNIFSRCIAVRFSMLQCVAVC